MHGPPDPSDFWAKLKHEDDDRSKPVTGWHPLLNHSAEVAAVTEALLTHTILNRRLGRLIGQEALSKVQAARFAALAAIHDAGKVNHGFQNRSGNLPGPRGGHVQPIINVIDSPKHAELLLRPLGVAEMMSWFSTERDLMHVLLATWGHHGRPVRPKDVPRKRLWVADERRDPIGALAELGEHVQRWFPAAFEDAPSFPSTPAFQHAFNGVLTLADWIGSDQTFFGFAPDQSDPMPRARRAAADAMEALFIDTNAPRAALGAAPVGFRGVLEKSDWSPHPIQQACLDLPVHADGSLTVLESDTGSGKTEAALACFFELFQAGHVDGLYFAVPTRSAATQLHGRVRQAAERVFAPDEAPPVVQAVPGYIRADDHEAVRLPGFKVRWDDDTVGARGWAAEGSKRYLAGALVVGTVDQVLLSTLQVNHAHMRAAALLRHFLVIDEVHASDVYMTALIDRVLDHHLAAGGHALLMSATLGAAARTHYVTKGRAAPVPLTEAEEDPYPLLTHVEAAREQPECVHAASVEHEKTVRPDLRPWAGDPQAVAQHAVEQARRGARVLIIRNRVADCRATQRALEEAVGAERGLLFGVSGMAAPHHSRFAPGDRRLLDDAIEAAFGKAAERTGGLVAVATQTVQMSLDIDADLLLTDLCPMDVLLQRVGRLHRHRRARPGGFEAARCVVLVPEARDLSGAIRGDGSGHDGKHGLGTVYEDLRVLEATWRVLEDERLRPWRIPKDNRRLVERATHPERLDQIVANGGEPWRDHRDYVYAHETADRQLPKLVGLDRSKPFGADPFDKDSDLHAKTRLGLDDYQAPLPSPEEGPFGEPVSELSISGWENLDVPDDAEAEDVEPQDGGFSFTFCGKRFDYDRYGLNPLGV